MLGYETGSTYAYESRISLAEMRSCQKTHLPLGVSKKVAEEQIPYGKVCDRDQKTGKYNADKERVIKGEGPPWDAYNLLTEFATHTTLWTPENHRRILLMNKAINMLRKKPDIVSYIEIYPS